MPKRSTAFVTALAGSALMLASAAWLAEVAPERVSVVRRAFEHSPERWAIIWPAVAVLGLALQLTRSARKKRRAADD